MVKFCPQCSYLCRRTAAVPVVAALLLVSLFLSALAHLVPRFLAIVADNSAFTAAATIAVSSIAAAVGSARATISPFVSVDATAMTFAFELCHRHHGLLVVFGFVGLNGTIVHPLVPETKFIS